MYRRRRILIAGIRQQHERREERARRALGQEPVRRRLRHARGLVATGPQRRGAEVHRALHDARLIERDARTERRVQQLRLGACIDRQARRGPERVILRQRRGVLAQVRHVRRVRRRLRVDEQEVRLSLIHI